MIAANKRLLKATLTEGVLEIQSNLIELYSSNLSAVGTQAALIAGFAFTSLAEDSPKSGYWSSVLDYFFNFFYTITYCSAIFALTQSTIVVMFGPSMALKANDSDAVRVTSEYMRQQQMFVFFIGVVAISSMFIGICIYSWAALDFPVAGMVTVVYLSVFYLLLYAGVQSYTIFLPPVDVTIDSNLKGMFLCCFL